MVSLKIAIHAVYDPGGGQPAVGLHDRPLALDPMRFQRSAPGAFHRHAAGTEPPPAVPFHARVMGAYPTAHFRAHGPGGVRPNQHQDPRALGGDALDQPAETRGGDVADGTPLATASEDLLAVGAQPPVTAECLGIGSPSRHRVLPQMHGRVGRPSGQGGLGQPAPPGLIATPQAPVGRLGRQRHQPVAALLFRRYCGSGRVRHGLARRQLTPRRWRAWRMFSMRTRSGVRPRSQQPSATKPSVRILRGVPKVRGLSCHKACGGSRCWASRMTRGRRGRRD
jgi:hypothetical protein